LTPKKPAKATRKAKSAAPTPPAAPPVSYTAVGASDAVGIGGSVPCAPLLPCPTGTGYAPVLARRIGQAGGTVTFTNLGIPGAVVNAEMLALSATVGSGAPADMVRTSLPLVPATSTLVTVFAGGISDATAMLGIEFSGDLKALAQQILAEFPNLTHAAFTLRDGSTSAAQCFSGALYEAATGTLHTAPVYTITQVIDRLGAGDAFTAGLVFSFLQHSHAPTSIAFATAAGCLAHSIEGDYNYSTRAEIEAVMQGDGGGRVSR